MFALVFSLASSLFWPIPPAPSSSPVGAEIEFSPAVLDLGLIPARGLADFKVTMTNRSDHAVSVKRFGVCGRIGTPTDWRPFALKPGDSVTVPCHFFVEPYGGEVEDEFYVATEDETIFTCPLSYAVKSEYFLEAPHVGPWGAVLYYPEDSSSQSIRVVSQPDQNVQIVGLAGRIPDWCVVDFSATVLTITVDRRKVITLGSESSIMQAEFWVELSGALRKHFGVRLTVDLPREDGMRTLFYLCCEGGLCVENPQWCSNACQFGKFHCGFDDCVPWHMGCIPGCADPCGGCGNDDMCDQMCACAAR